MTPDMTAEMRWFRSPNVGVVSFSVLKQMSYSASLSSTCGTLCQSVSTAGPPNHVRRAAQQAWDVA